MREPIPIAEIDRSDVQRLIDLYDAGEYLDMEDESPIIEAAREWLRLTVQQ